jgi:hypothetical protein
MQQAPRPVVEKRCLRRWNRGTEMG